MASPGNLNQQGGDGSGGGGFDVNKLFKPSSGPMIPPQPQSSTPNSTNLTTSPSFPPSSPSFLTPSSSYPPPTGPYPYQQHLHPHYLPPYQPSPIQQQHLNPRPMSTFPAIPTAPPSPGPNPSPGVPNLMAFFSNQNQQPDFLQPTLPFSSPSTPPPSSSTSSDFPISSAPPISHQQLHLHQPTPMRMQSSKLPKGRHLIGDRVLYDIDVRMEGEAQPQLEVTPITKYNSDPGLVIGRQIAVNRSYICYGLKPGAIRILNINTALRSLLRGHTQRVTDMAFFAEDVHLLASASIDGRVFIWKINEGPDVEDKPQILGTAALALKIIVEGESVHPRVCWHPHKQEILMVAMGNRILKIDTLKVGKGEAFSAEEPLNCPIHKLINGVQLVGKHDGEVTDLSMCQWMTTRSASASTDGTVKIWEDRKAVPLAVLRPHDGHPVNSVTFLTASHRPDHIVLITGGSLNREMKIWTSTSEEGWLLPSDTESWQCSQTLELKSSAETNAENAFFNQVVTLPRAGLLLLANAKKNAIYAVHIDYGPYPAATRMDYVAEFTVTMPILSLTGTSDSMPNGEHIVQVYCVQTQAIQQYALDLSQCLPPPLDNMELDKTESNVSRALDSVGSDRSATLDASHGNQTTDMSVGTRTVQPNLAGSYESAPIASHPEASLSGEVRSFLDIATKSMERKSKTSPSQNSAENIQTVASAVPLSPRLSGKSSGLRSPSNNIEPSPLLNDHNGDQPVPNYSVNRESDTVKENAADVPSLVDNLMKDDKNVAQNDILMGSEPPITFKNLTHLVTPSEILSRAPSPSESSQMSQGMNKEETKIQDVVVNKDAENAEVEVKVVGETGATPINDRESSRESHINVGEKKEKSFYSQASDLSIQMVRDCCVENYIVGGSQQSNDGGVTQAPERPSDNGEEEDRDIAKDVPENIGESENQMAVPQSTALATKGKRQKGKGSQVSGPSSSSPSPFNSTDSSNEPGCSTGTQSGDAAMPQLLAMQNMLDQLVNMQKEMQKQMNTMVSVPVNKEGKRLEASLGRSVEKVVKANADALWARFQEDNAKHEKLERDRTQQIINLITNSINKDLPATFERTLKKELASVGPAVSRAITPSLEKCVNTAITESFQKGVGEKAVNQLEKSVNAKLEATVARQLQVQFQTSGKQALQDAFRSNLEASIIPAFEMSCKTMFEQVDATFQTGLTKYVTAAAQQFESLHSPLAMTLREAISSASSITRTLSGDLADGQRKLLAIAAAGANSKAGNPLVTQLSNGPLASLHGMVEAPVDPTTELSRLIAERKYEEAFTQALHRSDVSIVSWLCSKVDMQGILAMKPIPLSQGVLLSLLQQLSCDISKETPKKLEWMYDVTFAINPADPLIARHVLAILDQVSKALNNHLSLPTNSHSDITCIRLLMRAIADILKQL
ncbi:enhancer of mRNA-decapping protein 4-like [Tripterygium wilfordii]|nr:enhancer of mRNA-decapping protein 4-like [Tripterygium wilfordii]